MTASKVGKCHLCGQTATLTFEHVPPRAAFNKHRALMYKGSQLFERDSFPWDLDGVRPDILQRGIGWNTLCGRCNSWTGGWFGDAFADFIYKGFVALEELPLRNREWVDLHFPDIYPLRIAKQIVTMFSSVNHADVFDFHSDLRGFALNRYRHGLDVHRYGLYGYVLTGSMGRYIGLSGIAKLSEGGFRLRTLSELAAPPFGFILEINPHGSGAYTDLLHFANKYQYDDMATLTLRMPVYESNTAFPADHRSRQEVMDTYLENKRAERERERG